MLTICILHFTPSNVTCLVFWHYDWAYKLDADGVIEGFDEFVVAVAGEDAGLADPWISDKEHLEELLVHYFEYVISASNVKFDAHLGLYL